MTTFADLKAAKTRPTVEVRIVLDREWGQAMGEAQVKLDLIERQYREQPGNTALAPEIERLEEEIGELKGDSSHKVAVFRFQSLAPDRYEKLANAHPPSRDQQRVAARLGKQTQVNEAEFAPALVHACLQSVEMGGERFKLTLDEVREMFVPGDDEDAAGHEWNQGELADLYAGAMEACLGRPRVG